MYKGFKIEKNTIGKILEKKEDYKNKYENVAQKIKLKIKRNLENYLLPDKKINVEKLRDDWFPTEQYDIFISHSHKDIEDIEALAGYLIYVKKLRVFVDSFIWGYFKELQKELDNKYNSQGNGSYNYDGSNWCCNNVSIILNSALQEVIDKSEVIFFYNTPNSITHNYYDQDRTESPWIFSEIETTRIIEKRCPKRLQPALESYNNSFKKEEDNVGFSYPIEKSHLINLSIDIFNEWIKENTDKNLISISFLDKESLRRKREEELDRLYSIVENDKKRKYNS